MCVIIVKPIGKLLPSYKIIKAAWQRNSDGGGFVTPTRYFRSLDFNEFYRELIKVKKNEPCIIHLRWATHGSVKTDNCHPFYDYETGVAFAHNGVLSIRPQGDMTDSETAFSNIIVPTIKMHGYQSKEVADVCGRIIGASKFALMQDGKIRLFGHYQEMNGILYSNLHFISYYDYCFAS